MLIYSAIQIEQIRDSILATQLISALDFDPWPSNFSNPVCYVLFD